MKGKNLAFILLIFVLCLTSFLAVSAEDNLTIADIDSNCDDLETVEIYQSSDDELNDDLQKDNDEILTQDEDPTVEILSEPEVGTFSELANLISSSGNLVNLTKDYKYTSSSDGSYSDGITISKTVTINGNGRTIDGSGSANIFRVSGSNVVLNNITFTNPYRYDDGSAIYATGSYFKIYNSQFKNCNAQYGVVLLNGYSNQIINTTFDNCHAYGATAIYWVGFYGLIDNCVFKNNDASYESGGAVYLYGSGATVRNSVFINNSADTRMGLTGGGALYVFGNSVTVENCEFYNNTQKRSNGGALYWGGRYGTLRNSIFINNKNTGGPGGAVTVLGFNNNLYNNYYESNYAFSRGGGLFFNNVGGTLNNETFVNNVAYTGGGAFLGYDYYESTDMDDSKGTMSNSRFINNTAIYGGGGFDAISHFVIKNTELINNTARNYGGGASIAHSTVDNITFDGNDAVFGGGIFMFQSTLSNSRFADNNATYGNSIYVITTSDISDNNTYREEDYYLKETVNASVIGSEVNGALVSSHDIDHMLVTADGYYGYCSEMHNSKPYSGEYDHSMQLLKNAINGVPVAEYLKILIYQYVDHMQDLRDNDFHNYVWGFTDRTYWNSTDSIIREVVALYDSGFRVPSINACKVLANGTLMYLNFSSMITPSSQQNLFLFKYAYGDVINETLSKESLNKTAFVGDEIEYRIVVSNKGNSPIYNLWVEDKDYSNGLKYENWTSESGNWTYDNQTQKWFIDVLGPGKSASILLFFRVMVNGTLYNNATSGVGNKNITVDTNETIVYNPNFTVEKISLNQTVFKGNLTQFKIVIKNVGDIPLNNVFVEEFSFDGLQYYSWDENQQWRYKSEDGKHRWYLNDELPVDDKAEFTVIFKTTEYGNFTNIVVAGSNETDNKTVNDTVEVTGYNLTVSKLTLTKKVVIGQIVEFEIVVKNNGNLTLEDVFVLESKYDSGLVYVDYNSKNGNWQHSVNHDGKHLFTLKESLEVGESASFCILFNTTKIGNFSNTVEAGYNNTTVANSTNTTEVVNKTEPKSNHTDNISKTNKTSKIKKQQKKHPIKKDKSKKHSKRKNINKKVKSKKQISKHLKVDDNATGHPVLSLLLVLILIPVKRFLN